MRYAFMGICIFTAACSGQPLSPTSSSGVTSVGAQAQASGRDPVEVTFTKWVPAFPALTGVTGGDVPGTFAGTVLSGVPFDNGNIVQLEAEYQVIGVGENAAHSFTAHIEGKQNNETQTAVFNGSIVKGWLLGAQVHVTYDRIAPCPAFGQGACFTGVIRVMPGSAN